MAAFTVEEVCKATGGTIICQGGTGEFGGICTDTRSIADKDLFVALSGERFDGHDFVDIAVQNGASGVLVSKPVESVGTTVIKVDDTLSALQKLANFHRRRFAMPIIAVTGSNGKTTTKDMLAAILNVSMPTLKTAGNFNNEIGLPLTLLELRKEHRAAVVEMGMRGRGEIAELAKIAEPTGGIVTNVGETHLELLGTIENITAAKRELPEAILPSGFCVLNGDDKNVSAMRHNVECRIIDFGIREQCAVRASDIKAFADRTEFVCTCHAEKFSIALPTQGRHNIYNALAAIAAAHELGIGAKEIVEGLSTFHSGAMRQNIINLGYCMVIDDVYNASPLSMAAALDVLGQMDTGRRVAILGDMLELGTAAIEAHKRVGNQCAEQGVELLITVGELAEHIAVAAQLAGIKQVLHCNNTDEAASELINRLCRNDIVLVKGSRGMKMEEIVAALQIHLGGE